MAKSQSLKLSALKQNVDYPVANKLVDKRCLIHVKLTESCLGAIEALMNSDKGAFFSLWFDGAGGTISIPVSGGESRKYEFCTGVDPVQKGERHGGLECVHQEMESTRNQQLTCLGSLEYKLTVKANEDIYDRTVKLMRQVEEDRNKTKAQEIQLPGSRQHRKKINPATVGVRKPVVTKPAPTVNIKPRSPTLSNSARNPRTLNTMMSSLLPRERITYLLAIKPLRRADIVSRLKKDTKRSESAMSNLDSILAEVSDGSNPDGYFRLKSSLFAELQIDDWPFYSEAEKQLVRRNLSLKVEPRSDSPSPPKRPLSTTFSSGKPSESTPKRLKVSHTPPSQGPPSQGLALQEGTSLHHARPLSSPAPGTRVSSSVPTPVTMTTTPSVGTSLTILRSESAMLPGMGGVKPTLPNRTSSVPSGQLPQQRASLPLADPAQPVKPVPAHSGSGTTNGVGQSQGVAGGSVLPQSIGGPPINVEVPIPQLQNTLRVPLVQSETVTSHSHKPKKKKKNKRSSPDNSRKENTQTEPIVSQEPSYLSNPIITNLVTMGNKESSGAVPAKADQSDADSHTGAPVASSTTNIPDMLSQYPPIASDRQRSEYKCIFNKDYDEYLKIKESLDAMTKEWQGLGTRLGQLQKHSEEAKELRKKIRKRYMELQQDHKYTEEKRRHEELHCKLSHIKQLIVDYDSRP